LLPLLRRLFFALALERPERAFFFCRILPIFASVVVDVWFGGIVEFNQYRRYRNFFVFASPRCWGLGVFVRGSDKVISWWSDHGDKRMLPTRAVYSLVVHLPHTPSVCSSPMASRFMPSRRMGFALIAGCLLFSALAAATASPGDLSVGEIEEQLQVIHHELGST
jgi:hypothetical protein